MRRTSRNPFIRFQDSFERGFERLRLGYQRLLTTLVHRRFVFVPVFLVLCLCAWLLCPGWVKTFFPTPTAASLSFTCAPRPARALKRLRGLPTSSKTRFGGSFRPEELDNILDNIGLPYSTINYMHNTSGLISAGTQTSWCPSRKIIVPRLSMSGSCVKSLPVNSRATLSISYLRILSRRF